MKFEANTLRSKLTKQWQYLYHFLCKLKNPFLSHFPSSDHYILSLNQKNPPKAHSKKWKIFPLSVLLLLYTYKINYKFLWAVQQARKHFPSCKKGKFVHILIHANMLWYLFRFFLAFPISHPIFSALKEFFWQFHSTFIKIAKNLLYFLLHPHTLPNPFFSSSSQIICGKYDIIF